MTEKERLLDALFPRGGGKQLVNLRFLPIDPGITEEELCSEFLAAREEHHDERELKIEKIGPYLSGRNR